MEQHPFIMTPGQWLGEGKIKLNMMDEELSFFTRWKIPKTDQKGKVECVQEIQVVGLADLMLNEFSFFNLKGNNFNIELENQSLGKVVGDGLVTPESIAWEFRLNSLGFEGFELYERSKEDEYKMHAEYATTDEFRTIIHGRIWKQALNTEESS